MQSIDQDASFSPEMISKVVKEEADNYGNENEAEFQETKINNFKNKKIYFQCEHCDKKIVKSNFYVKHMQEEHVGKPLTCCFCSAQFESGELFLDHVKLHGRNKKRDPNAETSSKRAFSCGECDRKVVKSSVFVKHVQEEHGDCKFYCSFCNVHLDSSEDFLKHVKSEMCPSELDKKTLYMDQEFPCIECKKVFKTINYLQCHNRTVHQIQVTVCEYCCKEFKNRDYYKKHVKLVHEAHLKEPQVCDVCNKTFKSKPNLYHHKKAVHETNENMICYICANVSKNEQALRKHVRKCEMKAKRGPNPLPLGVYTQDIHVEGDKFICKLCQKAKPSLKSLTAHIRVAHTHEPVLCHLCNNHMKNVDYLKKHYRVKHFITDIQTINQFVKLVKPEHDSNLLRQKNKQLALDRVGQDMNSVKSKSVDYKEQRQELVRKWRQMEEEQARETQVEPWKLEYGSSLSKGTGPEAQFHNSNLFPAMLGTGAEAKVENKTIGDAKPDIKTEDDQPLPECEVKLEASDDDDEQQDEVKYEFSSSESDSEDESEDEENKDDPEDSQADKSQGHQCNECTKYFPNQKSLYSHKQFVHSHESCICKICDAGFKNQKYLQKHLLRSHKGDPSGAINGTNVIKTESNIPNDFSKFSVTDEAGVTKYECQECSKVFEGIAKMKAHIKNVHTFGNFLCPECGKEFILKQQLKNHINNHHNVERLKGKTCGHCLKVVRNLKRHTKEMHTDEQFVCQVCAKTFRSRNQLRNHTTMVHPVEEQAAFCPACAKPFANSYYMKKHLRLVHGNMEESSTQISCEECGKQFANEVYLHHHKKYAHESENSICEMCNRSYKNKRALQRHIRYAHSGKDNPSPIKNISTPEGPSPFPQTAAPPSAAPSPHPAPPTPQHQPPVSPPSTTHQQPGQWYDQHNSMPMDIATSQLEVARQQLQYMQRMQMDNQGGQWHPQQGQGWFPRLY